MVVNMQVNINMLAICALLNIDMPTWNMSHALTFELQTTWLELAKANLSFGTLSRRSFHNYIYEKSCQQMIKRKWPRPNVLTISYYPHYFLLCYWFKFLRCIGWLSWQAQIETCAWHIQVGQAKIHAELNNMHLTMDTGSWQGTFKFLLLLFGAHIPSSCSYD